MPRIYTEATRKTFFVAISPPTVRKGYQAHNEPGVVVVVNLLSRRWLAIVPALALTGFGLSTLGLQASASGPGARLQDGDVVINVVRDGQSYVLRADFLVLDDGSGSAQRSLSDAKAQLLARLNDTAGQTATLSTSAYVLNGYSWQGSAAPWSYNAAGKPASLSGEFAAIQAAAATWSSAGANFAFGSGSTGSGDTGACSSAADGTNTIGWQQQSGSILAVTCSLYSGTRETEFDMRISPSWTWTTGSTGVQVDVQSVVLHELGHAAGLGHSSDASAVMYASYTAGSLKRALAQDDINGLLAIYGRAGATATATATSSATATATATRTATATPTRPPSATATSAAPARAAMTSPAPGSTLPGTTATFSWSAGSQALEYFLYAGTSAGANNVYAASTGLNQSASVPKLPTTGAPLYIRLWTRFSTGWQYNDYTYTQAGAAPAATKATLLSPANGSATTGGVANFSWSAADGAQQYFLYVGTSQGANNIFAQSMGLNLSTTLGGIPRGGARIWVRVWTLLASGWVYSDSSFTSN